MATPKKRTKPAATSVTRRPKPRNALDLGAYVGVLPLQVKEKELPGDCIRRCLPPAAYSLISQFGGLISTPAVDGQRQYDATWGDKYAQLIADRFGYPKADVVTVIKSAIDAWNLANRDDAGEAVPFP